MEIGLTHGEVTVLATHLDVSPSLIVGERSDIDIERLVHEGLRSLLARRLAALVDGEPQLNVELLDMVRTVLAPDTIVTYTRVESDDAAMSTLLIRNHRTVAVLPMASEATLLVDIENAALPDGILKSIAVHVDGTTAHRLESNSFGTRESNELSWVHDEAGQLHVLVDEEPVEIDPASLEASVRGFLELVASEDSVPEGA